MALIHGLGLCREVWAGLLPVFEQRYKVLNYDLYGHGDSSPPPTEASLTVFSDQLAGLMDHVGIKQAAVLGFSIGGMINRRFALDHRDRSWALVILNSPHDRGDAGQRLVEERATKVREAGAFSTFHEALKRWFTPAFLAANPEIIDRVRDWRGQVDAESYAQAAWVLANGVRELIQPEPPITAPTLVMTAENDSGSTPEMSRAIAGEIEAAVLEIVPGLQHLGLIERPELFSEPVMGFLEGLKK